MMMRHEMTTRTLTARLLIAAFLTLGALGGCTSASIKPEVLVQPEQPYGSIALGEITIEDELWRHLVPHLRQSLAKSLAEKGAFETVMSEAPEFSDADTLVLSGHIDEVDKGSSAVRFLIGFGAGAASMAGDFEIHDAQARTLVRFAAEESYAGGIGLGGIDFVDMEDLAGKFGESVAASVSDWAGGGMAD